MNRFLRKVAGILCFLVLLLILMHVNKQRSSSAAPPAAAFQVEDVPTGPDSNLHKRKEIKAWAGSEGEEPRGVRRRSLARGGSVLEENREGQERAGEEEEEEGEEGLVNVLLPRTVRSGLDLRGW